MLVFTRRIGEGTMIGSTTQVVILGIKGNQVRLGINAPKEISVHREEVYQQIKQEKNPKGE